MSKMIDADNLKESIAEKYVGQRRTKKDWSEEALSIMETIDSQQEAMITCCKCHGKCVYDVAVYNESGEIIGWNPTLCELCHGTGKISLQFYEDIQKRCRR